MPIQKPAAFSLIVSALLFSPSAGAQESVEAAADPNPFSMEGLRRMESGLEFQLSPGYGSFTDTTDNAFTKNDNTTHRDILGGALTLDASLAYRLNDNSAIGLEGIWHKPSAVADGETFSTSNYSVFARFMSGPDAFASAVVDFNAGLGFLDDNWTYASPDNGEPLKASWNLTALTLGAKVGVDFRLTEAFPNLRVGPFLGGRVWLGTHQCSTRDGNEICRDVDQDSELNPDVLLYAGLGVRFDIPLGYKAIPPKPRFVLVTSKLMASTSESNAAEVTDTPQYLSELPNVKQVALKAPSECASNTAANTTGQAAATGTVVKTDCGVEMGELERALTRAGYIVQSWSTLAAMVRDEHITPTQAAAKMGAQVLFQVNSLENVRAQPSQDAQWERRFFISDEAGTLREPANLLESDRDALRGMVYQREGQALGGARQGAMLDINAILVSTWQTIWFYRWQKLDTGSSTTSVTALARKLGAGPWQQVDPVRPYTPNQPQWEDRRSVEVEEHSHAGGPQNSERATYFRLMREVVGDFVSRFTHPGTAGGAK